MASNTVANPDFAVIAKYTAARIPDFKGNPLIEGLPPPATDDALIESLMHMPSFEAEQRQWPTSERMHMLGTLQNFMMPMTPHISLCYAMDRMLRTGYVGRAPKTRGYAAIVQDLYERQAAGQGFSQSSVGLTPQMSTALIGVSGMGKTTTVRRWCAQLPKVIFHPQANVYQIPALHIEMPANGASVRALAIAIFHEVDRLIPDSNYTQLYTKGKPNDDMLILNAAQLMSIHCVGLLICDEIQNLANSKRGSELLMTQLVSMCNVMRVPILFIGTNKASKVLTVDLRQARRATGEGIAPWSRLMPEELGGNGEWEAFVSHLWDFQWVKRPVALAPAFSSYLHWASQGVIGLAIKFFSCCQIRAMLDGTESLNLETMQEVYAQEFKLVHPMLEALRSNKLELLSLYDDITPIDFEEHLGEVQAKIRVKASPIYASKLGDDNFKTRLEASLIQLGVDVEVAQATVDKVVRRGTAKNLFEAMAQANELLASPKAARRKSSKAASPQEEEPSRFDSRPLDYRRGYAHAAEQRVGVAEMLRRFGMVPTVEEILQL